MSGVLTNRLGRASSACAAISSPNSVSLPLGGAPGEVAVGLGEAQLGQPVQPGRAGERLGQEQHVGVDALDPADQPRPEVRRLGVRIVDAEDLDAVVNPVPHHAQHLHVEAGRVVVEVERIDVLVLLRRVLGVGDGAVRQFGEPLPVVLGPRMVGSALQRQVEGHLQAQIRSGGDEVVEVLDGAQLGVHGVVATRLRCRSPRVTRRHPARRSRCCCGPCGVPRRSGGSAAGRRRRNPSLRPAAAPWRPWRRCRARARRRCPAPRWTGETTRTRRRSAPAAGPPRRRTAHRA